MILLVLEQIFNFNRYSNSNIIISANRKRSTDETVDNVSVAAAAATAADIGGGGDVRKYPTGDIVFRIADSSNNNDDGIINTTG